MSKIGLKPIDVGKANIEISNDLIKITGAKGSLEHVLPKGLSVKLDEGKISVGLEKGFDENDLYDLNILWGSSRSLIQNKIKGVTEGFQIVLIISGLGFKTIIADKKMTFSLGYSHKLELEIPKDIVVEVDKTGQRVTLKGIDKNRVGDFAAKIKSLRKVEPYKGTGIFIEGEKILRKAGKSTK